MKLSVIGLATAFHLANAGPAYKFPIERRTGSGLQFTSKTSVPSYSVGSGNSPGITNFQDNFYTTTITICGQTFPVYLDTGSSDLWVKPSSSLKGAQLTKLSANITYVDTSSYAGPIALCPVTLGSYSAPTQALIDVDKVQNDNFLSKDVTGLVGLSFDGISSVTESVKKSDPKATWGRSLLTNLFYDNPKAPNFIAFLFDRASDLDTVSKGSFTVGETEAEFASVLKQPALPVFPDADVKQWTVALDSMTVNGVSVPLKSAVKGAPSGKTITLLDSGTSLLNGPKAAVDAIYKSIPGSFYYKTDKVWIVPCLGTTTVSFQFKGVACPIHPLDLTTVMNIQFANGTNGTACMAAIQETDSDGEIDWTMGDTFLRNVYSVFDFGDLDTSSGGLVGHPFIKLQPLPSSDPKVAVAEFKKARSAALATLPPTFDPSVFGTSAIDPSSVNDVAAASDDAQSSAKNLAADASGASGVDAATIATLEGDISNVAKYLPIILGLLGANVLVMLVLSIAGCVFFFKIKGRGAYQPVKTHGY